MNIFASLSLIGDRDLTCRSFRIKCFSESAILLSSVSEEAFLAFFASLFVPIMILVLIKSSRLIYLLSYWRIFALILEWRIRFNSYYLCSSSILKYYSLFESVSHIFPKCLHSQWESDEQVDREDLCQLVHFEYLSDSGFTSSIRFICWIELLHEIHREWKIMCPTGIENLLNYAYY